MGSAKRKPTTPYSAKFSVPFCIAVGLYFGKAGLLEFTEEQIKNRKILNLCSKISYEIDPKNEYPKNYSGEINIILKNSQVIQEIQPGLRGGKYGSGGYKRRIRLVGLVFRRRPGTREAVHKNCGSGGR